jgi:hypothetical protein
MGGAVNIYLDTNMWDALFDGGVQPEQFVPRLAKANKRLVLGLHAFYELARIFQSPRPDDLTRGKALFEFLGRYLDASILCAKDHRNYFLPRCWCLRKAQNTLSISILQ